MRGAPEIRSRFSRLASEIQQQRSHEWLLKLLIGINKTSSLTSVSFLSINTDAISVYFVVKARVYKLLSKS